MHIKKKYRVIIIEGIKLCFASLLPNSCRSIDSLHRAPETARVYRSASQDPIFLLSHQLFAPSLDFPQLSSVSFGRSFGSCGCFVSRRSLSGDGGHRLGVSYGGRGAEKKWVSEDGRIITRGSNDLRQAEACRVESECDSGDQCLFRLAHFVLKDQCFCWRMSMTSNSRKQRYECYSDLDHIRISLLLSCNSMNTMYRYFCGKWK